MNEIDYRAVLGRKLGKMFPDPLVRRGVEAELKRYGGDTQEQGACRVRLAILKLAGTSSDKIREWVDVAEKDFRDVLACAEYPKELVTPTWRLPDTECEAVRASDADQYRRWIEEE
jgi:hypothetical protein